jgi:succinate dehydrogenase / fumarate reductase, membrane anchor subunit
MSAMIDAPRAKQVRAKRFNIEKWGWIYMRASGVVLVALIFGHLFFNVFQGEGVKQIDFGFVAGKWASPFWRWYDFALLFLALLHGANGMRTIVNDYAKKKNLRIVLLSAIGVSTAVLIILGTLVIFTLDPCPTGGDPSLLPSFCATVGK